MTTDKTEIRVNFEGGELVVRPLAENALRVRFSAKDTHESQSLVLTERTEAPACAVTESPSVLTLSTACMKAVVDRATGAISFQDANGMLLLTERPGTRVFHRVSVGGEPSYEIGQTFESPPEERLFGTGQFQDGYLNIRGLPRRLTQVNSQISIPFLYSSKGYGLLWHNYGLTELNPADQTIELKPAGAAGVATTVEVTTADGTKEEVRQFIRWVGDLSVTTAGRYAFLLDVGQTMARRHTVHVDGVPVMDMRNYWLPPTTSWLMQLAAGAHEVTIEAEKEDSPRLFFRPSREETVLRSPVAEALDYVVIAGRGDEIIATYRRLTGPAPLLPRWAFGYVHCRERFKSQKELLDTAAEFRRRRIPMDLIVQDWQYWGAHGWNAMRFDEKDYPNPAGMTRELHGMNARCMLSVWSKIDQVSALGKQFVEKGYYIPDTDWVDFFNPAAAAFYWENMSRHLLSVGIDAWWLDATEPENDDLAGRTTFVGPGERMRAAYPLFVTKTAYEGQRRDAPGQRVFILTRSAFAGSHRYAAATWSGDIGNDWETLRRQIPAGLNFSATGMPWWTTDCGGFFRPGPGQYANPDYQERFIRWFQFSTFCPLLRVHGYQTDTEPWLYGEEVEREVRRYLDLRYRLFPYIYGEAARVSREGSTLMRPLVMDFPDDPEALDQRYQFMFGHSLLVSPVLAAGARTWRVYLPRNHSGWIDFWTGEHFAGGQMVDSTSTMDRIPLHVRAGSIVPLGPATQFIGEKPDLPIELRVYPGADATLALYEDEGVNYDYEKGAYTIIPITWDEGMQTLSFGARQGGFPGMSKDRFFHAVKVTRGNGNGIEGGESGNGIEGGESGNGIEGGESGEGIEGGESGEGGASVGHDVRYAGAPIALRP